MVEFKVGDKVRRVVSIGSMPRGFEAVITKVNDFGDLGFDEWDCYYWFHGYFELVEEHKPKPWLKVTPPQPEQRRLVDAELIAGYKLQVCDCSGRDGYDSVRINEGPYGINKETLRELGETLIEISKEMK